MLNNYKENCRPIRILEQDAETGARIGGNPPDGIVPEEVFYCTEYFATLVIDGDQTREISIFNSFEMDVISDRSFLNNKYIVFPQERAAFIQFVIHDKSTREKKNSDLTSTLSSHALILEPEEPDADGWLDSNIYRGSKMGGYPLYWQNKQSIRGQGKALLDQGFTHLFQFAFPDDRDGKVSGNWPYGEYILHVFVDDPKKPKDIRYGWG